MQFSKVRMETCRRRAVCVLSSTISVKSSFVPEKALLGLLSITVKNTKTKILSYTARPWFPHISA